MPILLFDIDGTLVRTGGAGKTAMETGLREEFGIGEIRDVVPYSGRTDRAIGRDLLSVHGIDPTPANQARLQNAYLVRLPPRCTVKAARSAPASLNCSLIFTPSRASCLVCSQGMSDRARNISWGISVSGITSSVAALATSITSATTWRGWRSWRCGLIFGRDFDAGEVWVIGDTPLDVQCARAVGARAVAVATGWHPIEELAEHKPDFLLADLSDAQELLRAWT